MRSDFHPLWSIEHAAIFQERDHPASGAHLQIGRLPRHPDQRSRDARQPVRDFRELHAGYSVSWALLQSVVELSLALLFQQVVELLGLRVWLLLQDCLVGLQSTFHGG